MLNILLIYINNIFNIFNENQSFCKVNIHRFIEKQDFNDLNHMLSNYDSKNNNSSDEEFIVSNLSYIIDIDTNE